MTVYPRAAVSDFARQVRANLRGLSPEEIEDLTEGLEADLAAALADSVGGADGEIPDPVSLFGTPASYAAELQAAAGLDAPVRRRWSIRASIGRRIERWQAMVTRIRAAIASTRGGRILLEQRRASRPAWWIARGWLLYVFVEVAAPGRVQLVPSDLGKWLGLAALIVASYAWGMTMPRWPTLLRRFAMVASVGLVLVGLPAVASVASLNAQTAYAAPAIGDGVYVHGQLAENIYPYDAEGKPLTGIQLFDQDGRPIRVGSDAPEQYSNDGLTYWRLLPATSQSGAKLWNVYPLTGIADDGSGHALGKPSKVPADTSPLVGPLAPDKADVAGPSAEPTVPATTPGASGSPSSTPSPSAAASTPAKPSASPSPSAAGVTPTTASKAP